MVHQKWLDKGQLVLQLRLPELQMSHSILDFRFWILDWGCGESNWYFWIEALFH